MTLGWFASDSAIILSRLYLRHEFLLLVPFYSKWFERSGGFSAQFLRGARIRYVGICVGILTSILKKMFLYVYVSGSMDIRDGEIVFVAPLSSLYDNKTNLETHGA